MSHIPGRCHVVELRQYTLKPGQRDLLIDVFDRHFVESQEAAGMTVIGQFRDRQRSDRFVWLRGFADMEARRRALEAFYGGPVWAAHKHAANDTMLDSDDVLLLRPARAERAFRLRSDDAAMTPHDRAPQTVLAGIYQMAQPATTALVTAFEQQVAPRLQHDGIAIAGVFVTEYATNTFTRLPVREGEHVLAWFGTADRAEPSRDRLAAASEIVLDGHAPSLLVLDPTSRSVLGHGPHARRATKHDFDFLLGSWTVHNRYLNGRLRRSFDWTEFDARVEVERCLDGFGHLFHYNAIFRGQPFEGLGLRLFDLSTGEWHIHWADTIRARTLLPPMVGRFIGDAGEFLGDKLDHDLRAPVKGRQPTRDRLRHRLLQIGVALFLFSSVEGFAIPVFAAPRLGLSVHTLSALQGVVLVALGLIWPRLRLGDRLSRIAWWCFVYSTFATLVPYVLAAIWGAGNSVIPLAAGTARGTFVQEMVITSILYTAAPTVLVSLVLILWGLRQAPVAPRPQ